MKDYDESGRITVEMYERLTASFRSSVLLPSGPVTKRPGMKYVATIKESTWRLTKNGKGFLCLVK